MIESFGYSDPEDYFALCLNLLASRLKRPLHCISIGSGNAETETRLLRLLRERGVDQVKITCMDINPHMHDRGRQLAISLGVGDKIRFLEADFNDWSPDRQYDMVLANQSLHHVVNLESLFDAIRDAMTLDSMFIVSDIIGRNGHQRWPEALAIVQEFWREMPQSYRYNSQLKRHEEAFVNWDCSCEGFEGIRAQDILPLMIERFGFEHFFAYGNIIDPFIDRSFGHHFHDLTEWDLDFIDRVHARDELAILAGVIKPTHLHAVLRKDLNIQPLIYRHLAPEFCVHKP